VLNLFRSDPLAQAHNAILSDDRDKLIKQLKRIKPSDIDKPASSTAPSLVETCILQQQPKHLSLVLDYGASASGHNAHAQPFGLLSLQQEQSLPLLTALLAAGNSEDKNQLMTACFEYCPTNQLMLHIALLTQYGAEISDSIVIKALELDEQALIHFLLNSGATLPTQYDKNNVSEDILTYAKKCVDDLKIRQMFL
tara:strand:+ start:2506 stop:3093 length:588 start_codon:yes stop_codon:yes gene_type:complete